VIPPSVRTGVTVQPSGAVTVVSIAGVVDAKAIPMIRDRVTAALTTGLRALLIDLTDARLLVTVATALLALVQGFADTVVRVFVVADAAGVLGALAAAGADTLPPLYGSLAAALAAVRT
jgi:hypothetical protein